MVEVGLIAVRDTVREEEGSARVNISILQGTLRDNSISFIVITTNGSAAGKIESTMIAHIMLPFGDFKWHQSCQQA